LGFATGWTVVKLVEKIFRRVNRAKTLGFQKCPVLASAGMAFMHGAQDGQKFMGVFMLGGVFNAGTAQVTEFIIPNWMLILCSAVMATVLPLADIELLRP